MIVFLIILVILLGLSIATNIVLIKYSKRIVKDFFDISNDVRDVFLVLKEYENHLNYIYELELYYGDETLRELIKHTRQITQIISGYNDLYFLVEEEQEEQIPKEEK